jgi:hypothetical protein
MHPVGQDGHDTAGDSHRSRVSESRELAWDEQPEPGLRGHLADCVVGCDIACDIGWTVRPCLAGVVGDAGVADVTTGPVSSTRDGVTN